MNSAFSRITLVPCLLLLIAFTSLASAPKSEAFGTINGSLPGVRFYAEHENITRAALSCEAQSSPRSCFGPKSISNLAGMGGSWGAVGAPDNMPMHGGGGPSWWHCDEGDFIDQPGYPHSRTQANHHLNQCQTFLNAMIGNGLGDDSKLRPGCRGLQATGRLSYRCEGVVEVAHQMLNTSNRIDISEPDYGNEARGCTFNGDYGRIKCLMLQQFGYALHAVEDFYSHSNYTDTSSSPFSIQNPPGLEMTGPSPFLAKIPRTNFENNLATGCYPDGDCEKAGRATHGTINKDRAMINPRSGYVTPKTNMPADYMTPRGGQSNNEQNAVRVAILDVKRQWENLQARIIEREGTLRGNMIICALSQDEANKVCQPGVKAASIAKRSEVKTGSTGRSTAKAWTEETVRGRSRDTHPEVGLRIPRPDYNVKDPAVTAERVKKGKTEHRCGTVKLPGVTVTDVKVWGTSCASARKMLTTYRLSNTAKASQMRHLSTLICDETGPTTPIRCGRDMKVLITFKPDCMGGNCDT